MKETQEGSSEEIFKGESEAVTEGGKHRKGSSHLVGFAVGIGGEAQRGASDGAAAGHDEDTAGGVAAHVLLQGRRHLGHGDNALILFLTLYLPST